MPALFRLGSVPYVNAIPLVLWFEEMGDASPVHVEFDVPSRLPARLDAGEVDAILVSSIHALRTEGMRLAGGVGIASDGPVLSVRLFSQVPFSAIKRLAWDASSMTSNALAMIVLGDLYGTRPETVVRPPDLDAQLAEADAGVLIGDLGMTSERPGLHVLDLGEAWQRLTGLPFLWAAWTGGERLTPELALLLNIAASVTTAGKPPPAEYGERFLFRRWACDFPTWSAENFERVLDRSLERCDWHRERLREYLRESILFELSPRVMEGYAEYQRRLVRHGFEDCVHWPDLVQPK